MRTGLTVLAALALVASVAGMVFGGGMVETHSAAAAGEPVRYVAERRPAQGAQRQEELSAWRLAPAPADGGHGPAASSPFTNPWQLQATLGGVVIKDISFPTAQVGYIAAELGKVWKTTDGGAHWASIMNLGFPYYWYGVHALDANNVVISGFINNAQSGVIRRSQDGGATWSPDLALTTRGWSFRVRFADALHGLVLDGLNYDAPNAAHYTTNGGPTPADWTAVVPDPAGGWFGNQFSLLPSLKARAAGITYCTSLDLGATWSCRPSVDPVFDGAVFFADDQHGWVGGGSISPSVEGWAHRTTDGGATWSGRTLNNPWPIRELRFVSDQVGWAAGGNIYSQVGGMYYTSDGGQTWSPDLSTGAEMDACDSLDTGAGIQVWCAGYTSAFSGVVYTLHLATITPTPTATTAPTNTATPTAPTSTATATITCTPGGAPGPWASRATYPEPMFGLAVASDGTSIYGFAGRNAGRRLGAYKYNYATDSWTPIATVVAGAGHGLQAEYGYNGKFYVTGGPGDALANRIYDIASDSWSLGTPVPTPVSGHGHAYWNGKVYVIGGQYSAPLSGVYAYDIASDTWSTLAPLPQAQYGMISAAINGKIYIANGITGSGETNNLYIYDINTDTWSEGPRSPLVSRYPAGTVIGGKLYMIGGGNVSQPYSNTYLYDPTNNSWSAGPSLNVARYSSGAATINTPGGQTAVVVGGVDHDPWLDSVEASTLPVAPCATVTGTPPTNTPTRTPTNTPTAGAPSATRTPTVGASNTPVAPSPSRTPLPPTNTVVATNTPASTNTATPCPLPFADVGPSEYFYPAVRYLYCHGVISGYADNTFRPYNNTTRGQLAKIVVLAEGWPIYTPPIPTFRDVPTTDPFYAVIETAYHQGIISGYTCGTGCLEYRPGNNVTRAQLCKIIVLAENWDITPPGTPTFRDVPKGDPFYGYIETAYSHGIISGYSCGNGCLEFRPGNNATRGQICKIVYLAVTQP